MITPESSNEVPWISIWRLVMPHAYYCVDILKARWLRPAFAESYRLLRVTLSKVLVAVVAEQKLPLLHINRTWKTRLRSRVEKLPCNCWAEQLLKSGWTTAEKAYKITAVSIKEIRKQENMKNASNQSRFTTEEKPTVTINQGNSKNRELQRT